MATKVKETRPKPPAIGAGGYDGSKQSRVRALAEGEAVPVDAVEVPANTPVTDWEDDK